MELAIDIIIPIAGKIVETVLKLVVMNILKKYKKTTHYRRIKLKIKRILKRMFVCFRFKKKKKKSNVYVESEVY